LILKINILIEKRVQFLIDLSKNMKQYLRTTHKLNKETGEWIYRGDEGQDKHKQWKDLEIPGSKFSLGVHILDREEWLDIDTIVNDTIYECLNGAIDYPEQLVHFIESNPTTYKSILKREILDELNKLAQHDLVKVRHI
jgi:hypothetical protein